MMFWMQEVMKRPQAECCTPHPGRAHKILLGNQQNQEEILNPKYFIPLLYLDS